MSEQLHTHRRDRHLVVDGTGEYQLIRAARRWIPALTVLAVLAVAVSPSSAAPPTSNSANAKKCQKEGWRDLVRSDGSGFASEKDCTSYAAKGGTLKPRPTGSFQSICTGWGGTFSVSGAHQDLICRWDHDVWTGWTLRDVCVLQHQGHFTEDVWIDENYQVTLTEARCSNPQ